MNSDPVKSSEEIENETSTPLKDEKTPAVDQHKNFFKARQIKTSLLLTCLTLVGMARSIMGPSFVDLLQYFRCDARMFSYVMPIHSCGVLLASFFLIFRLNRLSSEMSICLAMVTLSVLTMAWTSVKSIYWYLVVSFFQGISSCLIVCVSQPYLLHLWTNHRLQKPVIHSIHALISLGLAIGPLVVTPLLMDRNNSQLNLIPSEKLMNYSEYIEERDISGLVTVRESTTFRNEYDTDSFIDRPYTGLVQYAYLTIGFPLLIPTIILIVVCLKTGSPILNPINPRKRTNVGKETNGKTTDSSECKNPNLPKDAAQSKKLRRVDRYLLIGFTLVFYTLYSVMEFVPVTYLTIFVSMYLGWGTPQRTLINSALYGSLCFGRILGILISTFGFLKQKTILAINLFIVLTGSSFLLFSRLHDVIMWTAAAILGFGYSLVYGAMYLWLSESIKVNDRITAAITVSTSAGIITGPLAAGQLMVGVSPMWMTYIVLSVAIAELILYSVLRVLESRRKRYRKLHANGNQNAPES